jgi:hypothetical protein
MKCRPDCRVPDVDRHAMCMHGTRAIKMGVHLHTNLSKYTSSLSEPERAAIKLKYGDNLTAWYANNASTPEQAHFRTYRQMLLDRMPNDCWDYYNNIMKPGMNEDE